MMSAVIALDRPITEAQLNEVMRYRSFMEASLNSPALSGSSKLQPRLQALQSSGSWRNVSSAFTHPPLSNL